MQMTISTYRAAFSAATAIAVFPLASQAQADPTAPCNTNPAFARSTECGENSTAAAIGATAVGQNLSLIHI